MACAPVVMFVYKRLAHTKLTLESLANCKLSAETDLYVYSDGARSSADKADVESVRSYIRNITGFKTITITEREQNVGLARNIIDGVSAVVQKHGTVIVLEDDLLLGKNFLSFMNHALSKYQSSQKVWHISGWNYPISAEDFPSETFFIRSMNCWGWATWADRWAHYKKDLASIETMVPAERIKEFNLDGGYDFYSQISQNLTGKISTWAIFWYATIFKHQGLCLNPVKSLVQNIGLDGSGENCGVIDRYDSKEIDGDPKLSEMEIKESALAVRKITEFYQNSHPSLLQRVFRKFNSVLSKLKNG